MSIVAVVVEQLSTTVSLDPFENGTKLRGSPPPAQGQITLWSGGHPRHRHLHEMFFNQANWCINMYPKQKLAKKKIEDATTCLPQGIAPP
jgi:hypothetical protein